MKRLCTSLSLALLLAGCTVGPDYQAPKISVPTAWSEGSAGSVPAPELNQWWTAWHDSVLNSLEERALQSNLDLRMAAARVREARAAYGIAASGQLPAVGAVGGYARERLSPNSPIGPLLPNPNTGDWTAGFDAGWELDFFGRVRRGVEAAGADAAAVREGERVAGVTVVAEVARAYIDLRAAQRRLAIAEENLTTQRGTVALVEERSRAGLAADFDVARAKSDAETTEATLPLLRREIRESIYALGVLLGREPGSLTGELTTAAQIPAPPAEFGGGLPSDLLRRRPDIRRAERELAAANARIGVAQADFYPRIDLKAALGVEATRFAQLGETDSHDFSVGPSFGWALFDAGKIRQNVRVHDARRDEAEIHYEQVVLDAFREVETALLRFQTEADRRTSLAEAEVSSRRALELAHERYRQGAVDLLGVLDAQRLLFSAQDALAQSYQETATQFVALCKSLGGGPEGIRIDMAESDGIKVARSRAPL